MPSSLSPTTSSWRRKPGSRPLYSPVAQSVTKLEWRVLITLADDWYSISQIAELFRTFREPVEESELESVLRQLCSQGLVRERPRTHRPETEFELTQEGGDQAAEGAGLFRGKRIDWDEHWRLVPETRGERGAIYSPTKRVCYDVLGEMGRGDRGIIVYLARDLSTERLVALKLEPGDPPQEFSLEVVKQLDSSLPAAESRCPSCSAAPQVGWGRYCPQCGADMSGFSSELQSPAELLEAVREAASDEFEVLGEMDRAEGGGRVYFARDRTSGGIVALRLEKQKDSRGSEEYALSQTRLLKPLAAELGGSRAAPAPPKIKPPSAAPPPALPTAQKTSTRMTPPGSIADGAPRHRPS